MFPPLRYAALEAPSLVTTLLELFISVLPPGYGGLESNTTHDPTHRFLVAFLGDEDLNKDMSTDLQQEWPLKSR